MAHKCDRIVFDDVVKVSIEIDHDDGFLNIELIGEPHKYGRPDVTTIMVMPINSDDGPPKLSVAHRETKVEEEERIAEESTQEIDTGPSVS